jgi:dTDP-4-dehydrorhamnose reductase
MWSNVRIGRFGQLYVESDEMDGISVYAKTKSLGEINQAPHVTIRTSIIGPEIKSSGIGLFHWFMQQRGDIRGYRQVFWNGVTTLELAKATQWCIRQSITGLVDLAAPEKLSKYELLHMLQAIYTKNDVNIIPDELIHSDKSLTSTRSDFLCKVPSYSQMLTELRDWMVKHSKNMYVY